MTHFNAHFSAVRPKNKNKSLTVGDFGAVLLVGLLEVEVLAAVAPGALPQLRRPALDADTAHGLVPVGGDPVLLPNTTTLNMNMPLQGIICSITCAFLVAQKKVKLRKESQMRTLAAETLVFVVFWLHVPFLVKSPIRALNFDSESTFIFHVT